MIKREQDRANGPGSSWDRDFVQQPHLILSLGRNCILVWIDTKRIKPLPLPPRSTAGTLPPLFHIFSVYHPLLSSQLLGKMGSVVLLFTNETSEAQTGYGREQVNTLIVLVLL